MSGKAIRQAVILVGGKGTRLGEITRAVPKPMLPIAGGRPFVDYLLEMTERHGYRDIVLLAGYLGEALEAAYDGRWIGKAAVRVIREPVPLGTAGALTVARETLDPRFLLMNGDAFFDINLRALEQMSLQTAATATLALRSVADAARYGRVIEENGKVVAFLEKDLSRPGPGVINGGVYVLEREILDLVHDLPCSLEQDVFPALVERGEIAGREFNGYFLDIGLPETLEQGHLELPGVRVRPAAFLGMEALIDMADRNASVTDEIRWRAGAVEGVRALNDRGYYVFALGGGESGVDEEMERRLALEGAHIDRFYHAESRSRLSGLDRAAKEWPIVRERSLLVGGQGLDVEAVRKAGVAAYSFDGRGLAGLVRAAWGKG